jgi:hypothetical protein
MLMGLIDDGRSVIVSSGGGASPLWTQTDAQAVQTSPFAQSFSFNMATAPGLLVVGIGGSNQGAPTGDIQSASIGASSSNPLTLAVTTGSTTYPVSIWYGTLASSGTQQINATLPTGGQWTTFGMAVGSLTNLGSSIPTTTSFGFYPGSQASPYPTTSPSSTVTVPASGYAIVFCSQGSSLAISAASSTFTMDQNVVGFAASVGIGHNHTAGSVNPSFNGVNFITAGIVAATWS